MYCLYPNETLVVNVGFDGSGTHCGEMQINKREVANHKINVIYKEPELCQEAWLEYKKYFKTLKLNVLERAIRKIKKIFKSVG